MEGARALSATTLFLCFSLKADQGRMAATLWKMRSKFWHGYRSEIGCITGRGLGMTHQSRAIFTKAVQVNTLVHRNKDYQSLEPKTRLDRNSSAPKGVKSIIAPVSIICDSL